MEQRPGVRRSRTIASALGAVFLLAGCTSGGEQTPTPTATRSPAPVTGLRIEQTKWRADPSTWSVSLTWIAPIPPFTVDHYEVIRNGASISTTVPGTTFADRGVVPGRRYRYAVVGVDAQGRRTPPASAKVKTHTPPLADARLSGRYLTSLHVTSTSVGATSLSLFWVFAPSCKKGPCATTLTVEGHGALGSLSHGATGYVATLSAPFLILSCQGGHIDETLTVSIRIAGARAVKRAWVATAFSGTLGETASHAGCVTAHTAYTLRGRAGS